MIVEHINGDQQLSDTDHVTRYKSYLQMLRDATVHGSRPESIVLRSGV